MAAEMVSSAVAQEAVNKVLSRIKEGYVEKSDAKERLERTEMAHIKLEAALETSNMWNITSARTTASLVKQAQACHTGVRSCFAPLQAFQEEEEVQQAVQSSSFPKRVAHTAMSFVSSIFSSTLRRFGNDDKLRSRIQRCAAIRALCRWCDRVLEVRGAWWHTM